MPIVEDKRGDEVSSKSAGPSPVVLSLVAAWGLFCLAAFLRNRPIPFGTDRIPPWPSFAILTGGFLSRAAALFGRVALFWLAAWGVGNWSLRALKQEEVRRSERVLYCPGLGAGALGLIAFALGLAHALNPALLKGLLVALALASIVQIGLEAPKLNWQEELAALRAIDFSGSAYIPAAGIVLAVGFQALIAMGPTLFYDSLVYHLALPDLYLRHGAMVATPMNAYAGIPGGVEMLYAWLLPWGGFGSPCQLLHLSLGVFTAAAIAAIGARLRRPAAGLWGAAIFLTTPMVMLASGRPGIELGWSWYLSLCMLALLSAEERPRSMDLAAIFAGLALGTKYQAVLLLPAVVLYFFFAMERAAALKASRRFVFIAVAVAAPWGLRNIAFYRNPVFPFAGGIFAPASAVDVPAFVSSAHGRALTSGEGLREFLVHPWTYSMPQESSEADNVVSIGFLALLPLALAFRKDWGISRLLLLGALLWVPINLFSGLARFSIPALVPLAVACGLTVASLEGFAANAAGIFLSVVMMLNLLYVHSKADALLWRVLSGEIPVPTFLSHRRPIYFAPPYPAYAWMNEQLGKDARVLLVGEPRSFYLDRDNETSSPYAAQPIAEYANASNSGADLYNRLRSAGISHVYINIAAMSLSKQTMRMSNESLKSLQDFWSNYLQAVYVDQSNDPRDTRFSAVYRLLTEDEAKRPHPPIDSPFKTP